MGNALQITSPDGTAGGSFDKIFAFLREQFLNGTLRPGARLIAERDLAAQLGVSRPVLREALRALAVLGVLEIRQGIGTVVRRPDIRILGDFLSFTLAQFTDAVDDVMQARIAIECQAARLACSRVTLADLERLRAALDRVAATINDPNAGGDADHAFHAALVAAGHSETLTSLYSAISDLLLRSHHDRRTLAGRVELGRAYLIDHHRLIFDTLATRDADRIDSVLRDHFAIGDEYRRRNVLAVPGAPPDAAPLTAAPLNASPQQPTASGASEKTGV